MFNVGDEFLLHCFKVYVHVSVHIANSSSHTNVILLAIIDTQRDIYRPEFAPYSISEKPSLMTPLTSGFMIQLLNSSLTL